jgi:hypothetical protein
MSLASIRSSMAHSMRRTIICCDASGKIVWLLSVAVSTAPLMSRGTQPLGNHNIRRTMGLLLGKGTWPYSHCGTAVSTRPKAQNLTTSLMTRSSGRSDSFSHSSSSIHTLATTNLTTTPQITTKQSTQPKAQQTHQRKTSHSSHNFAQPKPSTAEDALHSPRS